ncbi:MAG: type II toxin-antitoxin system VapC family toxin [Jiangellaceae bacterium]
MILVDTSVWIDHLHSSEPHLVEVLEGAGVVQHPMIVGELALGSLKRRTEFLELMTNMPSTRVAASSEVLNLVNARRLYGRGLSLVDAHLLASVLLTPGTRLWTRDKRLLAAADGLEISHTDAD